MARDCAASVFLSGTDELTGRRRRLGGGSFVRGVCAVAHLAPVRCRLHDGRGGAARSVRLVMVDQVWLVQAEIATTLVWRYISELDANACDRGRARQLCLFIMELSCGGRLVSRNVELISVEAVMFRPRGVVQLMERPDPAATCGRRIMFDTKLVSILVCECDTYS